MSELHQIFGLAFCRGCEKRGSLIVEDCHKDCLAREAIIDMVSRFIKAVKKPIAEEKNPYPEDIFLPLSKEDLNNINKVLQEELGFSIDRLSGHIGRHTLNWHKEKMLEELDKLKNTDEQCDFTLGTSGDRCILQKGHKEPHQNFGTSSDEKRPRRNECQAKDSNTKELEEIITGNLCKWTDHEGASAGNFYDVAEFDHDKLGQAISKAKQWFKKKALECIAHEDCRGKPDCWACGIVKSKIEKAFK